MLGKGGFSRANRKQEGSDTGAEEENMDGDGKDVGCGLDDAFLHRS